MARQRRGRLLVKAWFDQIESELDIEARRAGLLGNKTLMGDARETLVQGALKSFIPDYFEIGRGEIIDVRGNRSKQIDIVVFDRRFPAFRFKDKGAVYPVEGVVAAIEVKSTWDSRELDKALDNCRSVQRLEPCLDHNDITSTIGPNATTEQARAALSQFVPLTYAFAFRGFGSSTPLAEAVIQWLKKNDWPCHLNTRLIPRVICGGGAVTIAYGGPFMTDNIHPIDDVFMAAIDTDSRFGWLACHLLHAIDQWLVASAHEDGIRRSIEVYAPFEEYFDTRRERVWLAVPWKTGDSLQLSD